jgi:hypothetical protein
MAWRLGSLACARTVTTRLRSSYRCVHVCVCACVRASACMRVCVSTRGPRVIILRAPVAPQLARRLATVGHASPTVTAAAPPPLVVDSPLSDGLPRGPSPHRVRSPRHSSPRGGSGGAGTAAAARGAGVSAAAATRARALCAWLPRACAAHVCASRRRAPRRRAGARARARRPLVPAHTRGAAAGAPDRDGGAAGGGRRRAGGGGGCGGGGALPGDARIQRSCAARRRGRDVARVGRGTERRRQRAAAGGVPANARCGAARRAAARAPPARVTELMISLSFSRTRRVAAWV